MKTTKEIIKEAAGIKKEIKQDKEKQQNEDKTSETKYEIGITCESGCEEFLHEELKNRFKADSRVGENWVLLDLDAQKLSEIMYLSQAAKRMVMLIGSGSFDAIEDLEETLSEKMKGSQILPLVAGKSMRIVCDRTGNHDFNSMDAEQAIMASLREIAEARKIPVSVNLNAPDVIFYLRIADNEYMFGMDCAGRELSKRQHLVFNHANSIKGTIGYCALIYGGYKTGDLILDPFSLSGNIMIEAALLSSGISHNYYTKKFSLLQFPQFREVLESAMKKADAKAKVPPARSLILSSDSMFNNVSAQKKNAKIAGAEKFISFSRTDIYNLDIKSFDDRLDMVCSRAVEPSNHFSENQARNLCSTMFRTLKYVLKKDAVLVFIVRNPQVLEEEAEKEGYIEDGLKQVWQGQQGFFFVKFKPKDIKENWKEREDSDEDSDDAHEDSGKDLE